MYQVPRPLGLVWSDLWQDKLFRIGLMLKVLLVVFLVPAIQTQWFVPFIVHAIQNVGGDPWSSFLSTGGDPLAFPYGPVMLLAHLPTALIGWGVDHIFTTTYFVQLGFRLSLLMADLTILTTLLRLYEEHWKQIIIYYWLSPLVIFITYWHGQTDIIPVSLLILALGMLTQKQYNLTGVVLALSVAAKHSMLIAIPFILLYLWLKSGARRRAYQVGVVFCLTLLMAEGFLVFSDGFRSMVFANREVGKLYWLSINMTAGNTIYLIPLVFLAFLYYAWRLKRMNFNLLISVLGVAFSVIILMSPAPPGWILWVVPMYAIHQACIGANAVILVSLFSIFFITYHAIYTSGASIIIPGYYVFESHILPLLNSVHVQSMWFTLVTSFGMLITFQLLREGVRRNDYYYLGRKPLVIGVSGDSGTGKSTFSRSLASLFGEQSVVHISGDDYHNWDRTSPMWKAMTHLDPRANRLFQIVNDVKRLIEGGAIRARAYDHSTGRFTKLNTVKSKNVILVSGLHTLFPQQLIRDLDIKFFLDMDEKVCQFLKTRRDMQQRGYKKEAVARQIEQRRADREQFIWPQAERADVVFRIVPVNSDLVVEGEEMPKLQLQVRIRNGVYYQELIRVLVGVCGLRINVNSINEKSEVVLEVEGDVEPSDIKLAIFMLLPHMEELLDDAAEYQGGIQGIMQIIALVEINEELKRRRNYV